MDWAARRHVPQPGCPRCDARHGGGRVHHLLPHHWYVCTTHRYWIGPPDIGQCPTRLPDRLGDIVRAQHRHQRLVRRHGVAAVFDAVLTGFLICGHLWADRAHEHTTARHEWSRRVELLIPTGTELATFSASRVFAVVYPEAVALAAVIASPTWRRMATSNRSRQLVLLAEVARRLGTTGQSLQGSNAITHWMAFDAPRPPSRPDKTFPDTRGYGATRIGRGPTTQSLDRHDRSAAWFGVNRRGSNAILHHRHIRPVLAREWSTPMDGITATICASASLDAPTTVFVPA